MVACVWAFSKGEARTIKRSSWIKEKRGKTKRTITSTHNPRSESCIYCIIISNKFVSQTEVVERAPFRNSGLN